MSKSRFLNGAEASRRHGVLAGIYAAALMHADPLADAAVEAPHPFHGRWWPMVLKALEEGIAAVPDAPSELAALIASLLCALAAFGWLAPLYQHGFADWITPRWGPYAASLAYALAFVAVWWAIVRWLDARKIYFKV